VRFLSGFFPSDISANRRGAYPNRGWKGGRDWLGTGLIATNFGNAILSMMLEHLSVRWNSEIKMSGEGFVEAICPKRGQDLLTLQPIRIPLTPNLVG
jgi:hypothetical protein